MRLEGSSTKGRQVETEQEEEESKGQQEDDGSVLWERALRKQGHREELVSFSNRKLKHQL